MARHSNRIGVSRTTAKAGSEVIAVILVFAVWEFVAVVVRGQGVENAEKVFPALEYIFTEGFAGLARYCHVSMVGADQTTKGLVALVTNGGITLVRVIVGYTISLVLGMLCALHLSQHPFIRRALSGPVNIARVLPAFAMAPLFILWFGATSTASVVFIVFSVFFIVLVAELDSVNAIDPQIVEYAKTLGTPKRKLLYRVLLPMSLTGMRGTVAFAGLVAWTSVLSAELNGLQDGLGFIVSDNIRFSNIADMFLGAICFCVLSFLTMKLLERVMDRITQWRS